MSLAEYEAPYREIWNVFNASSEDSEVNVFSINEDTAAAHEAKVAGGYLPAIELTQEMQIFFDKNNYEMAVNLGELDFPWWDRWQFDVKNQWSDLHGLPGPRSLDVFQGYVITWQYNSELMEQSGLDPHNDVKTWDDLEKWLAEGAAWAAKTDGVDWFYNQAWHNWVFGNGYGDMHAAGLRRWTAASGRSTATWARPSSTPKTRPTATTTSSSSRPTTKAGCPTACGPASGRATWRPSYIAGKSVMMLHGPWVWDKALAAGSEFAVNGKQEGLPATPPADGQGHLDRRAPCRPTSTTSGSSAPATRTRPTGRRPRLPGTGSGAPKPFP